MFCFKSLSVSYISNLNKSSFLSDVSLRMNLRHWITQTDKGQTIYGNRAQTSHIFIKQLYIPSSTSSQYSSLYLFIYFFCLSACRGPTREGEMYSPNWHVRSLTSSYLSPAPQANNLQAGDIWIHRFSLQYSGLENSLDWIVCEVAELDMTEQLLLSLSRCLLGANGNNPFNALSKNEKKINVFCFVFSINNWESLLQ